MLLCEIVLVGAEVVFYYKVFTRDLEEDAAFLDRVIPIFIAVVAPVAAILVVRLVAGSVNRLREPHTGEREPRWLSRGGGIGAFLFSTGLLILICVVTVGLVIWRFEVDDQSSGGTAIHPPDIIFALAFVVMILADTIVRAFLFNPGKFTEEARRWSSFRTRRLDSWFLRRETSALRKWQSRYRTLESLVADIKNDADQAMAVATISLQVARGSSGSASGVSQISPPPTVDDFVAQVVKEHEARQKIAHATDVDPDEVDLRVPYVAGAHLKETDAVHLPLRQTMLADTYLRQNRPPAGPKHRRKQDWQDLVRPQGGERPLGSVHSDDDAESGTENTGRSSAA